MKKILILSIVTLFTYIGMNAQSPDQFKYQAVLRDSNGDIMANETVDVSISILYQDAVTGVSVFDEQHSVTTTAQGLINLNIGSIGTMIIDWSDGPYFIKISVNNIVMGTSQLLSVPYALHANTVEIDEVDDADADPTNELQDLNLNGTILAIENGNNISFTGWDTNANDDFSGDYNDLSNQPSIPSNVSDLSDFDTTGATNGQILQFNGTQWVSTNTIWTKTGDNLYYGNGNVGVGTINPIAKLHSQTDSGSQSTAYFGTSSTNGQSAVLSVIAGGNANPSNLVHIIDSSGEAPDLFKADGPSLNEFIIKNNGNVGIGTINPLRNLHIAGALSLIRFEDTDNNKTFDMGISSNGSTWSIYDKTLEKPRLLINSSNGNVGIGNVSPNAKLEVNADASSVGLIVKANTSSPDNIQEWKNGSNTTLNYVPNNGGIVFENLNTSGKGIKFMADQTAGVSGAYGTFQPVSDNTTGGLSLMPKGAGNGSLSIFGTDVLSDPANGRAFVFSANTSNFYIWPRNYGTETVKPFYIYKPGNTQDAAISVETNGNVGIGKSNPTRQLDVNGDIKLSGDLSIEAVDKEIRFYSGRIISQSVPNRLTIESFVANQPLYLRGPGGIQFVAGGERMRITDNGNVGVGTATPEAPLHISDFMKLEPRSSAPTSPTKGMIYYDDTDDKIKVYTGSVWENLN
jgi:hypothetical protein